MADNQCPQCKIIAAMRAYVDGCSEQEAYDQLHEELHGEDV